MFLRSQISKTPFPVQLPAPNPQLRTTAYLIVLASFFSLPIHTSIPHILWLPLTRKRQVAHVNTITMLLIRLLFRFIK